MYSTCLFCNRPLGHNEAIEHFPVGRRLAFDAAKGRLWVVCRQCERWNLTPLDERWEAIEEAERAYRDTKKRASTDNIGLARLSEGVELVRIGAPLRPEFAAWRYGDQFGRRYRKHLAIAAASVAALAGSAVGPVLGLSLTGAALSLLSTGFNVLDYWKPRATIVGPDGTMLRFTGGDWARTEFLGRPVPGLWRLKLRHRGAQKFAHTILEGEAAIRALAQLLPRMNRRGSGKKDVQRAVAHLEQGLGPARVVQDAMEASFKGGGEWAGLVVRAPVPLLLALEMSLHEEDERRALEGELTELTQRWKDAEEIAGISDSLTVPAGIEERFAALKKGPGND